MQSLKLSKKKKQAGSGFLDGLKYIICIIDTEEATLPHNTFHIMQKNCMKMLIFKVCSTHNENSVICVYCKDAKRFES